MKVRSSGTKLLLSSGRCSIRLSLLYFFFFLSFFLKFFAQASIPALKEALALDAEHPMVVSFFALHLTALSHFSSGAS